MYAPNDTLRFHRSVKIKTLRRISNGRLDGSNGGGVGDYSSSTPPWYLEDDEEEIEDIQLGCSFNPIAVQAVKPSTEEYFGDGENDVRMNDKHIENSYDTNGTVTTTEEDSYLCFDLKDNKKKMTHYLVRSAGTTATLNCNPRGL